MPCAPVAAITEPDEGVRTAAIRRAITPVRTLAARASADGRACW